MRIARIIEYFPSHVGGMERHGLILSKEQIKLGHEVEVFIGYGGDLKDATKSDFRIYKAPFQFLPPYSKARRLWFNLWACRKVNKNHQKNPYNIIHLHGDFIEAYFGGRLSKKLKVPAVITIHAGLNKRLLKLKNAKFFKNISRIICVSNEIAEDLESIGVKGEKIEIITSGIYLNEFDNADENAIVKLRNRYSKPIIISIGVLRINKGFTYLIEAFRQIKEKVDSATLFIIGDGPEKNNLKKQAAGVYNIYFLGQREHDKIVEYLKAADVFILASISTPNDREGTPTSIMEAMASGLPVIATKVGGNSYLVKEGRNGFLVESKNAQILSESIITIINNSNLREQMAKNNLEDIKQKDWPVVALQIEEVYKKLL